MNESAVDNVLDASIPSPAHQDLVVQIANPWARTRP